MGFKYVKKMTCFTQYSGNTGLRLDPQYTLVVKLVNQGVEIQKKKGFGGLGRGGGGGHLSCTQEYSFSALSL